MIKTNLINFNAVLETIKELHNNILPIPEFNKNDFNAYLTATRNGDNETATKYQKQLELHHIAKDNARENNEKIERLIKIYNENARFTLCDELMPLIIAELNKIAGKSFGEKTREKIRNYFKENYNVSIWFNGDTIGAVPLNENGYSISYEYSIKIECVYTDANNKILSDRAIEYKNPYKYAENPAGYLTQMLIEFNEIKTLLDNVYFKICDYNQKIVTGFNEFSYPRTTSFFD